MSTFKTILKTVFEQFLFMVFFYFILLNTKFEDKFEITLILSYFACVLLDIRRELDKKNKISSEE